MKVDVFPEVGCFPSNLCKDLYYIQVDDGLTWFIVRVKREILFALKDAIVEIEQKEALIDGKRICTDK